MLAEKHTASVVLIQPECAMKSDGMVVQVNLICAKSVGVQADKRIALKAS